MTIATEIATILGETTEQPRLQIGLIVKTVGEDTARAFLQEAQAIEASGGMTLADGTRRTPGGVFFQVVRKNVKGQARQIIFYQWRPEPWPPESGSSAAVPPMKWIERGTVVNEATPGKATSVKVIIVGRPEKVAVRDGFVFVALSREGEPPSLPKGVPAPRTLPATRYNLYIGMKQWRNNVDPYLREDKDDELIAEGTAFYDAEFSVIAVLVTSATTKNREQGRREQQLAAKMKTEISE